MFLSWHVKIAMVDLVLLFSQCAFVAGQQQAPTAKSAKGQAKASTATKRPSLAAKTWQTDWATFVDEYNKCLQLSTCKLGAFKDKMVTWHGVFKSVDEEKKIASVEMTPNKPALTDRNGKPGRFDCCRVSILDIDIWKALAARTEVTFMATVGKDFFFPLIMFESDGTVVLGDGRLIPEKKP